MSPNPPIKKVDQASAGFYEPTLGVTFLPRCANCGAAHPMAGKPPIDTKDCPECGFTLPTVGQTIHVRAVLTGWTPSAIFARLLFAAGQALRSLAEKL